MLKVHAVPSYNPNGEYNACAYIRVINPLKELESSGRITLSVSRDWKDGKNCDVFYLQRLCGLGFDLDSAVRLVSFCEHNNKQIIYELDDNLLDLKSVHEEEREVVKFLAKNAYKVVTSTGMLRERMLKFNRNITIVPNMLSIKQIGKRSNKIHNKRLKIGYMGAYTHSNDLQMILLPLLQILKKYSDSVDFELMGVVNDLGILQMLPNVRVISIDRRDHYQKFWEWVQTEVNWDIGIAPLKKTAFSVCKSDIKFLDYAAMTCCGIFSNHPAYYNTVRNLENGILADNTVESWYESLEQLILNHELRSELCKNACAELYDERTLENNLWRWEELLSISG